jgi:hypothetical protein
MNPYLATLAALLCIVLSIAVCFGFIIGICSCVETAGPDAALPWPRRVATWQVTLDT